MSKFDLLVDYINSTHRQLTRKEILAQFGIYNTNSDSTVSQYINLIKNAGFIIRTDRGKYKRVFFIPKNISTIKMKEMAYDKNVRNKFLRKEKLKKIENDSNL